MDILSFGLEDAYQGPGASGILERNLAAIALQDPGMAERIRQTTPRDDIEFIETREATLSARTTGGPLLASARAPITEGARLAESVDVRESAGICVLGFALGHHLRALAERLKKTGVILCYEPDLALLRAVLERIDHSDWIAQTNLVLLADADDSPAIQRAFSGIEGVVAMGFKFLKHPPSAARLADSADRFSAQVTRVLKALRTTIVTTLVHGETTLRNTAMNLDHYVTCGGIAELRGACTGRPAIVVSAGPSLERNIDLLAQPGVRDRVVIVAVQTVLKPLLARAIRPHYVTALDHHEISRRFYEGLTAEDVEGVTLIAEPKANPAILDAFPGVIRCARDEQLDEILGPQLARDMGRIEPGSTVAHLAYSFARHLGCDPVILTGQDLAFTDGQYYAAGAAIHDVWAPELGEFRTLETLEWERVARMRSLLRKTRSVHGGEVFTDEQMSTYLAQFERLFADDAALGRRTIDSTEGGAVKRAAEIMTLADALATFAATPRGLAPPAESGATASATSRRAAMIERLERVRADVWRVAEGSREAGAKLAEMLDHTDAVPRLNALIREVHAIRDDVQQRQPAFKLAQFVNQTGVLNRLRADRALSLEGDLSQSERQKRQIERDRQNVGWLAEAADAVGDTLDAAIRAHKGAAPKRTRDESPARIEGADSRRRRVGAIVLVDHDTSGLGTPRRLEDTFIDGRSPLAWVVERLGRCRQVDEIVLLSAQPERTCRLLAEQSGAASDDPRLSIESCDEAPVRARLRAVGAARIWSPSSWRGGVAGLTGADEVFEPIAAGEVMEARALDAAVFLGADWALIDPELTDAIIERYRSAPDSWRVVFTQAPAGLAPTLIDRESATSIASARDQAGSKATIGSLLGYLPVAPQGDPIAKEMCVQIPPNVRSACVRAIPDSPARRRELESVLGRRAHEMGAEEIAERLGRLLDHTPEAPSHVRMELCTGRLIGGAWSAQRRGSPGPIEREAMNPERARAILAEIGAARPDAAVTIDGVGDPLMHPRALEIVRAAKDAGVGAVHLRTDLTRLAGAPDDAIAALLDSGADVLSIDLLATNAETYHALTGSELYDGVRASMERLLALRAERATVGGIQMPWIVARMTRAAACVEEMQAFHDEWIMRAGASVIDPPTAPLEGERIRALPVPAWRRAWRERDEMTIRSDGSIVVGGSAIDGVRAGAGVPIVELHRAAWRARREAVGEIEAKAFARERAGRAA